MIFAIELEKYIVNIGIFGIIVGKFYYKKKPCLIILLKVNKGLKISFYHTILSFDLTIRLWIKSNKKSLFNAKEIA